MKNTHSVSSSSISNTSHVTKIVRTVQDWIFIDPPNIELDMKVCSFKILRLQRETFNFYWATVLEFFRIASRDNFIKKKQLR